MSSSPSLMERFGGEDARQPTDYSPPPPAREGTRFRPSFPRKVVTPAKHVLAQARSRGGNFPSWFRRGWGWSAMG